MYLLLCKNGSIFSILLRFLLWSRWSHSAMYDEHTDMVWESTFLGRGVKRMPFDEWVQRYPYHVLRATTITDIGGCRKWLDEQVGKPYDWKALVGFVFRSTWQDEGAWFCSELTEKAISLFGTPRFRASAHRITPYHQQIAA